jgi:hypothetical protein
MKISHELPLCLLNKAYQINDYDYLLPHLTDKYKEYNDYYLTARENNRFCIMDNGLFENVNHTEEDLIEKIHKFQPNIFITPDSWNDMEKTLNQAKYWKENILPKLPKDINLMAVIQAKTFYEAQTLYIALTEQLDFKHIAFNHSSVMYEELFPHTNKLVSQMMGRIILISKLEANNIINKTVYHHLLGCSLKDEFKYYDGKSFIKSVDTSNPIAYAIEFGLYNDEIKKPKLKIDDIMDIKLDQNTSLDIEDNILIFKSMIHKFKN